MAWSCYLLNIQSGAIGAKVEIESGSWKVDLNSTEEFVVDLLKSSLVGVESRWLDPWKSGVILLWDNQPLFAGPLISRPTESFKKIRCSFGGIRALLRKRFVTYEMADWSLLSKKVMTIKGFSHGTIAKKVVQMGTVDKPGGALPINYPIPEQSIPEDANHERNYRGYNIANINVDDVLTKLSGIHDGPDIMFRPRLVAANRMVWDMWTGSEDRPRIPQVNTPIWDSTAVDGEVTDLQIVSTGAYMSNRVYGVGDGMDEGTIIRVVQDLSKIGEGYPLLETFLATASSTPDVVLAGAKGSLNANSDLLREITLTVRADGVNALRTYWPGDLVKLVVKGWKTLDDGVHDCRLLHMSGGLHSEVRLSLQTERQINGSS